MPEKHTHLWCALWYWVCLESSELMLKSTSSLDKPAKQIQKKLYQLSKLTFSKSRLLATFMVAIKKFRHQKQKKTWRGGHFMTYYTSQKNVKGEDTSWCITRRANAPNGTFSTLDFAAVSLRIHVEFLNDERRKEKDRSCCRLCYWLNLSYY